MFNNLIKFFHVLLEKSLLICFDQVDDIIIVSNDNHNIFPDNSELFSFQSELCDNMGNSNNTRICDF